MSDPVAELELLRNADATHAAIVDRSDRGFVRVSGPDAFSFLQVLVSADLDAVADGGSVESLLLHPQGKLDVAFRLIRRGDEAWLDTDPGLAPQLVASLDRFKIRVDVQIVDRSDEWGMLTVVGPQLAPGARGELHVAATKIGVDVTGPRADVVGAGDPLGGPDGSHVPASPTSLRAELTAAVVEVVGADAWEAFRIERGIPRQPVDVDDSTIPQEAELEVDAVSFTKGCFIGQELVCRIDSRGHVNRFLRRLTTLDGARPDRGAEIVVDDKVVGAVTSVTPDAFPAVALGYVRREVEPGATVELRGSSGTATATVTSLRD